jgi:hypothetical protein
MKRVKNTNASEMISVLFTAPEEAVATVSSSRSALKRAALLRMVLPEWQKVAIAVAMCLLNGATSTTRIAESQDSNIPIIM